MNQVKPSATYQSKLNKIPGKRYQEIERVARRTYNDIARKSKRNPYLRSCYFGGDKIFLKLFWEHLNQKPRKERKARLKYYLSALDLLQNTSSAPSSKPNPNRNKEILHRFAGKTATGDYFYVQVKEDLRTGNKHFMSVFPAPKK